MHKKLLLFGRPNMGKSKLVEKYIESNYKKGLYVGSLLSIDANKDKIALHVDRRDVKKWVLFEVSNDLDNDINLILQLAKDPTVEVILNDGLTNMFLNYIYFNYDSKEVIYKICNCLFTQLVLLKKDYFCLDVLPQFTSPKFQKSVSIFQKTYTKIFKDEIQNFVD